MFTILPLAENKQKKLTKQIKQTPSPSVREQGNQLSNRMDTEKLDLLSRKDIHNA